MEEHAYNTTRASPMVPWEQGLEEARSRLQNTMETRRQVAETVTQLQRRELEKFQEFRALAAHQDRAKIQESQASGQAIDPANVRDTFGSVKEALKRERDEAELQSKMARVKLLEQQIGGASYWASDVDDI